MRLPSSSSPASHRPDLVFPQSGLPQGFATLATTQWDGNPEPVIRELLQNALDAAAKADRDRCEVHFTIRDIPVKDLPGIYAYREHFEKAVEERRGTPQGTAEKTIIARIKSVLDQNQVRILLCRDNGIGVNEQSMVRLLTEGNTDKEEAGAGAFGVGHLTAFAASDSRYVLYAGRSRGADDDIKVVSSAHAILASRTERDRNGIRGLGAHGYWLLYRGGPDGDQLGLFDPRYPNVAPALLDTELTMLRGSGSVICITAFNGFRSEDETALDAIARVAAKNFLVAIQRQEMTVHVVDETGDTARRRVVDAHGLDALLRKLRSQKRIKRGWFPGEQAYRCLRTLVEGQSIALSCKATAVVRRLGSSEGASSHVQLFRNGMWITNRADALTPPNFAGFNPFDAVVTIRDGEISRLVREAEGPEHRGLDRRRLRDKGARTRLLRLLRQIQNELQQHVGRVRKAKDYTPEDFAVFGRRGGQQQAELVREYRPRTEVTKGDEKPNVDSSGRLDDDIGPVNGGKTNNGNGRGVGAKPKPGRSVTGRMSVVAVSGDNGMVDRLRILWEPSSPSKWQGALGARIRIPSGSDSTCELPVGPRWIRIHHLQAADGTTVSPNDSGFEARLPAGQRRFEVRLAEPVTPAHAATIEVDIVRRIGAGGKLDTSKEES